MWRIPRGGGSIIIAGATPAPCAASAEVTPNHPIHAESDHVVGCEPGHFGSGRIFGANRSGAAVRIENRPESPAHWDNNVHLGPMGDCANAVRSFPGHKTCAC
ncbi:hypothetical protein GCM10010492_23090 [Saccharothrix mutabilis subsp. mutabilis]|uniref:Secreted protein n=1 Tax=Saccharothrix mutabilis subsp. mutabilis TaxID=66855 RepID=A0ABN0TKX2_9PSEU